MTITPTGTPARSTGTFSMVFLGSTTAESNLSGGTFTNAATAYSTFHGCTASATTEPTTPVASSGTLKYLTVVSSAALGAGRSQVVTIRINGVATPLTCTISGASQTSCFDSVNSTPIAAGTKISIQFNPSGTPPIAWLSYSVGFIADKKGEFNLMSTRNSNASNSANSFSGLFGSNALYSTVENGALRTLLQNTTAQFEITGQWVTLGAAGGAGTSWTINMRKNFGVPAAPSSQLTCAVAGATDLSCSDTSHVGFFDAFDIGAVQIVPAGTPTTTKISTAHRGFVRQRKIEVSDQ